MSGDVGYIPNVVIDRNHVSVRSSRRLNHRRGDRSEVVAESRTGQVAAKHVYHDLIGGYAVDVFLVGNDSRHLFIETHYRGNISNVRTYSRHV